MANECIFCKIAAGEIPSKTLYEDEQFRVILDLGPVARGHALIIPKEHYADLYALPAQKAANAMKLAQKMMKQMTEKLKCDGFNIIQNNGEAAGQTVFHFHMHLIPRYKGCEDIFQFKAGSPSQQELEEIKNIITG